MMRPQHSFRRDLLDLLLAISTCVPAYADLLLRQDGSAWALRAGRATETSSILFASQVAQQRLQARQRLPHPDRVQSNFSAELCGKKLVHGVNR